MQKEICWEISANTVLTRLDCFNNQLTELDLKNNTKLTDLLCADNQLIKLDLSNNIKLVDLRLQSNNLSTSTLNTMFRTLPNNTLYKMVYIISNTGTNDCDKSIATDKGWEVFPPGEGTLEIIYNQ